MIVQAESANRTTKFAAHLTTLLAGLCDDLDATFLAHRLEPMLYEAVPRIVHLKNQLTTSTTSSPP